MSGWWPETTYQWRRLLLNQIENYDKVDEFQKSKLREYIDRQMKIVAGS